MRFYAKTKRLENYKIAHLSSNDGLEIEINAGNTPVDYRILLQAVDNERYKLTVKGVNGDILLTQDGKTKPKPVKLCKHDWDRYGKCCTCGKYNIQGIR
mgnify:CR=1 FL=1